MSELEKLLNSVKLAKPVTEEDMSDELESVEYKYDNDRLYDYIALELAREFGNKLAFKGGYMLTKIMTETARRTVDVDLSILTDEIYNDIKTRLTAICEKFMSEGIIDEYTIKPEVKKMMTGGMDAYKNGVKILGVDVGWHSLSYGITMYDTSIGNIPAFEVERMLSDKVSAILSRKRFRRPKDLYDVYAIMHSFDFDIRKIREYIKFREESSGIKTAWENYPFSDEVLAGYIPCYEKLNVVSVYNNRKLSKPPFIDAYESFSTLVSGLLHEATLPIWNYKTQMFIGG